nr:hypothetical protein BaRGS_024482 [Batillaria attramentaria]
MACGNFLQRPVSYKLGVGFLVMGAVMLLVGFTAPYWQEAEDGSSYSDWWTALQVLESLGLLMVVLSSACTLFENSCWSNVNSPRLMQELTALFGGIFCLVGWVVFLAKTHSDSSVTFSWAFYVTVIASAFIVLAALIILFGGKMATKSTDLPSLRSGHVRSGHVSTAPARRLSHLWADSRPETPELAGKAGGAASPQPSQDLHSLPSLPPLTPPPQYDGNGAPSFNEPRMSIISMSAEQYYER